MNAQDWNPEDSDPPQRSPLVPMGLAIFAVLLVPIFLYSVGPEGPVRVGDVVFATERHRVMFATLVGRQLEEGEDSCVLESRVQLVIQHVEDEQAHRFIAHPIGVDLAERPFCPQGRPVVVYGHQVTLKADLWGGLRNTLANLLSP